jgi:release factor glutamine methyltransferase
VPNLAPERETWGTLLRAARDRFRAAGIESPEVEAELLMRQAVRAPGADLPTKAWLLPRLGQDTSAALQEAFERLVARRLAHEPTAYIIGVRDFHALTFDVTPHVLIPRPETELLVGKAVEWAYGSSPRWAPYPGFDVETLRRMRESRRTKDDPLSIVDVGTGSGAIAVSLARSLPAATIVATDVSWDALKVARKNAQHHAVEPQISFRHGDLLDPIDHYVDLIVANLPYVTENDWHALEPEVRDHEPSLALTGGADGLDLIRALLHQAPRYLRPGGAICLEFGIGQSQALLDVVASYFPTADNQVFDDFAGIPRVLVMSLPVD